MPKAKRKCATAITDEAIEKQIKEHLIALREGGKEFGRIYYEAYTERMRAEYLKLCQGVEST